MEKKVKINYQGRDIDAHEIDFNVKKEEWNIYELADGTTIRMKAVVSKILRAEDQYDPDGNPLYLVKSSNILDISASESLQRGAPKVKSH